MTNNDAPGRPVSTRWTIAESLKAFALLWIFLNHICEQVFGKPHFANPSYGWAPFSERWSQVFELPDTGSIWHHLFCVVGWAGDQAVGIFLVVSGFGLALSASRRLEQDKGGDLSSFFRRRLLRIYPIWIVAHLMVLLPPALIGYRVSIADWNFWLSLVGFRFLTHQIYYGVPAWWFVTLILQLYMVFPILMPCFRLWGKNFALLLVVVGSLAIRAAGMVFFEEYLDPWCRGAIFITRLPEFAVGIWFGIAMHEDRNRATSWLMRPSVAIMGLVVWIGGNLLSFLFWGNLVSPLLNSIGACVVAGAIFSSSLYRIVSPFAQPVMDWVSRHSISLFLVHHPFFFVLLPREEGASAFPSAIVKIGVALVLSVIAAYVLEFLTKWVVWLFGLSVQRFGLTGTLWRTLAGLTGIVAIIVPIELAVRHHAPQDVPDFGWSEKPSLQPDDQLGFKLKPSTTTRLQWESYDYVVESNSEGFPAPDYFYAKPEGVYRIMTLGDAFTSAEGVDTAMSWPRRLEQKLNAKDDFRESHGKVEVANFGITGFGPNQYADITTRYAETIQPDLIVIGFFTNDFQDVQTSTDEFRDSIGFDRAPVNCLRGYLTGRHLFRLLRGWMIERAYERIKKYPCSHARFFLQLDVVQKWNLPYLEVGRDLIDERFDEIQSTAHRYGSRVVVMAIPAPIQVADQEQLDYWRPGVQIGSTEELDFDQPQRLTQRLASKHGFEFLDLRPAFVKAKSNQPYQRHNLHWTAAGHECAASTLVEFLQTSSSQHVTSQ